MFSISSSFTFSSSSVHSLPPFQDNCLTNIDWDIIWYRSQGEIVSLKLQTDRSELTKLQGTHKSSTEVDEGWWFSHVRLLSLRMGWVLSSGREHRRDCSTVSPFSTFSFFLFIIILISLSPNSWLDLRSEKFSASSPDSTITLVCICVPCVSVFNFHVILVMRAVLFSSCNVSESLHVASPYLSCLFSFLSISLRFIFPLSFSREIIVICLFVVLYLCGRLYMSPSLSGVFCLSAWLTLSRLSTCVPWRFSLVFSFSPVSS